MADREPDDAAVPRAASRRAEHSDGLATASRPGSLAEHLAAHPESVLLLEAVRDALRGIGPTTERMTRSEVVFARDLSVVRAWVPGQYLDGRGAPLVLSFDLPGRHPSPRWKEIVEVRPGRFMHHLELWTIDDLDAEVQGWLRHAWEATAGTS